MQQPFFSYITNSEKGVRYGEKTIEHPPTSEDAARWELDQKWWASFGNSYQWFTDDGGNVVSKSYYRDTNGKRFFWVLKFTKHDAGWRLRDGWCFNNYQAKADQHFESLRGNADG